MVEDEFTGGEGWVWQWLVILEINLHSTSW